MSAMLGSKGGVKRIAVVGLGKKDGDVLTSAALEAIGAQVGRCNSHGGREAQTVRVVAVWLDCTKRDSSCNNTQEEMRL